MEMKAAQNKDYCQNDKVMKRGAGKRGGAMEMVEWHGAQ